MRIPHLLRIPAFALAVTASPLGAQNALPPGVWTNTEDAYFAEEEGRQTPEWRAFEATEDGRWRAIDAYWEPLGEWRTDAVPGLTRAANGGWQVLPAHR
ncbi:hypothetical protein [Leptolyngbya sp. 7M]|uniref:hypothetical protein n=1 Tax=Leptolyngbya sp. 7M TaxID=2812896 RepID=UPI001B8C0577|nr:hypothetical protein [Leptolyngbya sp. 7M]QYO64959.1 hypothetical protein JVX88_36445 [Leptolyngbya sp. 7M]